MDRNRDQNSFSNMHGTRNNGRGSRYRKKYKRAVAALVVFFLTTVFLATYLICEHWPIVQNNSAPVQEETQSGENMTEAEAIEILTEPKQPESVKETPEATSSEAAVSEKQGEKDETVLSQLAPEPETPTVPETARQ